MEYIETKFQLADIFTMAIDSATFIKFRDTLVVSAASTLNLLVKKVKEPKENNSEEPAEKKQRKYACCVGFLILFHMFISYYFIC